MGNEKKKIHQEYDIDSLSLSLSSNNEWFDTNFFFSSILNVYHIYNICIDDMYILYSCIKKVKISISNQNMVKISISKKKISHPHYWLCIIFSSIFFSFWFTLSLKIVCMLDWSSSSWWNWWENSIWNSFLLLFGCYHHTTSS